MDASAVRHASRLSLGYLLGRLHQDWRRIMPGVGWSAAGTVAHIADGNLYYAMDLSAGTERLTALTITTEHDDPAQLLAVLDAANTVLASTLAGTPAHARGWHPQGSPDASGFAAMACDEILIHTWDIAKGFGVPFEAPGELSAAVLRRLFPSAPSHEDSWRTLLWANGRTGLPGHPRQHDWRWHCSPLSE